MEFSDDEENFFIRRPKGRLLGAFGESEQSQGPSSPPSTPPMEYSAMLNKSLGIVSSPMSPTCSRFKSVRLTERPRFRPFLTSTPNIDRFRDLSQINLEKSINAVSNPYSPQDLSKLASTRDSFPSDSFHSCEEGPEAEYTFLRPRLTDFEAPRFREFLNLGVIGNGEYGCVFRCVHTLTGVEYAIKRSQKPLKSEAIFRNEIYAHAVLNHTNIVHNYMNWTEGGYLYMQNEYCNGGSLENAIKQGPLDETQLRTVLEHVAEALRHMHASKMAHMDVKPGNILIHKDPRNIRVDLDDPMDDEKSRDGTVYKIADLGHTTSLKGGNVQEGDCRYLPKEMFDDNYDDLTKVDIFALGLTLYEAAGGGPLPKNGPEYHEIRSGKIKRFPHLSDEMNDLMKKMTHKDPAMRPSAAELITTVSHSTVYKSIKEKQEIKAMKHTIQFLNQRLKESMKCVRVLSAEKNSPKPKKSIAERAVGKKAKRSMSATLF